MKKLGLLSTCLMLSGVVFADYAHAVPLFEKHNASHSIVLAAGPAHYDASAEKFVVALADNGIGFLQEASLSDAQRKDKFKQFLNSSFDMKTIGRFALGRHWRSASEAQKSEYLSLFNDMTVSVYSERFKDYQGQKVQVVGSRKEGDRDVLVNSVLKQPNGSDVRVDWRVRSRDGVYKVVDVVVEGVSMVMTQRSDFSSVVQRGGGNIEALLAHLRKS